MNQKELEEYPCFGTNCTKQLVQYGRRTPLLLVINFTDAKGVPHTAYSKKSLIRYFDAVWGDWKKYINIDRFMWSAEVAKKLFVDKTITKDDIDL